MVGVQEITTVRISCSLNNLSLGIVILRQISRMPLELFFVRPGMELRGTTHDKTLSSMVQRPPVKHDGVPPTGPHCPSHGVDRDIPHALAIFHRDP